MKKLVSALLASAAILTAASPVMAATVPDKPNQGQEGNTDPLEGKSFLKVEAGGDIDPGTHVPYLPGQFTFAQVPDLDFGSINLNKVQTASVTNELHTYTNSLSVSDLRPDQTKVDAMKDWFVKHPLMGNATDGWYIVVIDGDEYTDANGKPVPVGGHVTVKDTDYNTSKDAWNNYKVVPAMGYTISAKSTDLQTAADPAKMLRATSLTINGKETLGVNNTIVTVSDTEAPKLAGSIWDFFYGMLPDQKDTDSMVPEDASAYTSRTKPVLPTLTVRTSGLQQGNYAGTVTYTLTTKGNTL